jgi:hypothetical protein
MKKNDLTRGLIAAAVLTLCTSAALAQKAATPSKPAIFAVLNDGTVIEPIAIVDKGKLTSPVNGSDDPKALAGFTKSYYGKGAAYRLIFGSAGAGTVNVKSSDPKSDCGKNTATATSKTTRTTLKGFVMALATNVPSKWAAASYRRKPTPAEKDEIETLVKAEFQKQKLSPKTLHYQNLTAIDADNDGKAEIVGSYWMEVDKMTRALLFFIATKGNNGKYSMNYKDYRSVDQSSVMTGANITAVDEGYYNEVLLDSFDYDGDGVAEIFTYERGFEGSGFYAYHKSGGKWTRGYEFSNYHCAF